MASPDKETEVASNGATTLRLIEELDRVRVSRGESKADVARATGLGEPAVRRLFSDRRANPTIRTLDLVATHLGVRITIEQSPVSRPAPTMVELRSMVDIIEGIVTRHGGGNVRVFGSVARGDARPDSDVDLLIDMPPGTGLLALGALEDELSSALGRKVDVVTSGHRGMKHIHDDAVPLR